jgi:hypothetical protein
MSRLYIHLDNGTMRHARTEGKIGFRGIFLYASSFILANLGTYKYASLTGHDHQELCRKDDLESW